MFYFVKRIIDTQEFNSFFYLAKNKKNLKL